MTYLSQEISNIKRTNRFHQLEITEHAKNRFYERGFDIDLILYVISLRNTMIVQHHMPNEYHNNKDELFVLHGKAKINKKSRPLHIVIAKDGFRYKLITAYIPEETYFCHYGRTLKKYF